MSLLEQSEPGQPSGGSGWSMPHGSRLRFGSSRRYSAAHGWHSPSRSLNPPSGRSSGIIRAPSDRARPCHVDCHHTRYRSGRSSRGCVCLAVLCCHPGTGRTDLGENPREVVSHTDRQSSCRALPCGSYYWCVEMNNSPSSMSALLPTMTLCT